MVSWIPGHSNSASILPSAPSTSSTPRTSLEQRSPLKAIFLTLPISHARRNTRTIAALFASLVLLLFVAGKHGYVDTSTGGKEGWWMLRIGQSMGLSSTPDSTTAPASTEPQALTELGFEADLVYENMGSTDKNDYRIELEQFLHRSFPVQDSNSSDPDSLLSILHEFLPEPPVTPPAPHPRTAFQRMLLLPFQTVFTTFDKYFRAPPPPPPSRPARNIPQKIHQTSWSPGTEPPDDNISPKTWRWKNPDYEYQYSDNEAAKHFMLQRFNGTSSGAGSVVSGYSIADTYTKMQDVPVMQSDFWRYSVLASEGGVYSDLDTRCLKPVDGWHRFPWQRELTVFQNEPRARPSMIVGIEVDVGSRRDWHSWWPRPLGIVQWTMAGTKGHPILIDTMRRVSEAVNPFHDGTRGNISESALGILQGSNRKLDSVVEKSGPGPFTDSVLRYLGAKYNVTWPALQHLPDEGILFTDTDGHADVLVLSVTAFSPGVGNFGAGDTLHAAALVQHLFSGSWKAQHG